MTREFPLAPAKRERVPLLLGLFGPSGGGKTYSALRLATGIADESSGPICVIDTEARRALHYADAFGFQHLDFAAPFSSLAYLDAINQCVAHKPSVIIIDSMSHEHEGDGGMLDAHEAELQRRAGDDWGKRQQLNALAWAKPKADRKRLLDGIMQANRAGVAAFIFCFRSKEKMKLEKAGGKTEFVAQGWMPIGDPALVYEMTLTCLLLPRANGVPTWHSEQPGEKMMMKLPVQFQKLFETRAEPLSETYGQELARWARGETADENLILQIEASAAMGMESLRTFWATLAKADQTKLKARLEKEWKPAARAADAKAKR